MNSLRVIRYAFLSFLITFWGTNSYAQYYKRSFTDSLEKSLIGQEGVPRVDNLLKLSYSYYDFNLDTSLFYAQQARRESQRLSYDWGVYKGLYLEARVGIHFRSVSEVLPSIRTSTRWFYENGFNEDGIMGELLISELLSRLRGFEVVQDLDRKILKKAQLTANPRLQGFAWFSIKRHRSQIIKDDLYDYSLDSAKYYYGLAEDSAQLVLTGVYDILVKNRSGEAFEIIDETESMTKRWGNKKLQRAMAVMALHCHASRGKKDSVQLYADKTSQFIQERGSPYVEMQLYDFMGFASRIQYDIPLAIEYYEKAKEMCVQFENYERLCTILKEISKLHLKLDQNEEAINYLLEAIKIAELQQDEYVFNTSKMFLGKVYLSIGEYDRAQEFCSSTIPWIERKLKDDVKLRTRGACYFILGETYQHKEMYDSAVTYFEWAQNDYETESIVNACWSMIGKMSSQLDAQKLTEAEMTYNQICENYSEQTRIKGGVFYLEEGRLMIENGAYEKGIDALETYLSSAQAPYYSRELKKAYYNLYTAYESTGRHEKALEAHVNFKAIDDSLNAGQEVKNVLKIQSDYEISLREATIADLNKQSELDELRLSQQDGQLKLRQSYIVTLIFVVLFVMTVGYFLYRRLRLKRGKEKAEALAAQMELELENLQSRKQVEIAEVKNRLFSNVSHEFRTPLTLIKVPLQNYMERAPKEDRPIFRRVLSNTDDLIKMVDELLDLGKIETGEFELKPREFELTQLLAELKANFVPLFREKEVELTWRISLPEPLFIGDANQLKIVLNNILKNAYSHVSEKGVVECSARPLDAEDGVQIEVSNTGDPIAKKDLPHLFERYYRANEQSYIGNGIGLALSREIVEMHNGKIEVNNGQKGVTFRITLPGKLKAKPVIRDKMPVSSGWTQDKQFKTVLIVEDNVEMRELLGEVLVNEFKLLFAADGEEGESMCNEIQPDLILTDLMMPKKDGFGLLQSLKENVDTRHIPVLILSARTDIETKLVGFENEAIDYLEKPFDPRELKARIHNIFQQRKQLQERLVENPFISTLNINISKPDQLFLDKAKTILESHFHNGDFSVLEFCDLIGLNRNSTYKKIKAYTNQTTSEYIKNFRLEKALKKLLETDQDIAEIYTNAGFNSAQAFNKAFKSRFKHTPSDYRKKHVQAPT